MLHEKRIVLDPHLSLIAELAGHCECYADIGCDHGRLGAFMLQNDLCHRAQLTDISEPSLKKARALIALLDRTGIDRARRGCGDCGDGWSDDRPDCPARQRTIEECAVDFAAQCGVN